MISLCQETKQPFKVDSKRFSPQLTTFKTLRIKTPNSTTQPPKIDDIIAQLDMLTLHFQQLKAAGSSSESINNKNAITHIPRIVPIKYLISCWSCCIYAHPKSFTRQSGHPYSFGRGSSPDDAIIHQPISVPFKSQLKPSINTLYAPLSCRLCQNRTLHGHCTNTVLQETILST